MERDSVTLKELRKAASLSQEGVAAVLMYNQSAVSAWEAGRWAPAKKIRPTLAAIYRVPLPVLEKAIEETCRTNR